MNDDGLTMVVRRVHACVHARKERQRQREREMKQTEKVKKRENEREEGICKEKEGRHTRGDGGDCTRERIDARSCVLACACREYFHTEVNNTRRYPGQGWPTTPPSTEDTLLVHSPLIFRFFQFFLSLSSSSSFQSSGVQIVPRDSPYRFRTLLSVLSLQSFDLSIFPPGLSRSQSFESIDSLFGSFVIVKNRTFCFFFFFFLLELQSLQTVIFSLLIFQFSFLFFVFSFQLLLDIFVPFLRFILYLCSLILAAILVSPLSFNFSISTIFAFFIRITISVSIFTFVQSRCVFQPSRAFVGSSSSEDIWNIQSKVLVVIFSRRDKFLLRLHFFSS